MKRFICWYSYQGMETEGGAVLKEPIIIEAIDMAEAVWKWHHIDTPDWGEKYYNGDIDAYRKEGKFTGWGWWCEELTAPDVVNRDNQEREKYCILDWMDGSRKDFKNEDEAIKEFRKLRAEAIDHQEEFDMMCFKLLTEDNNVD